MYERSRLGMRMTGWGCLRARTRAAAREHAQAPRPAPYPIGYFGVSKVRYFGTGYSTDMPSDKKRITVYLDDESFDRIARFCAATGESRAAAVAGLIDAAAPMLDRVADLAGALAAAPDDVRATFAGAAEQLDAQYASISNDAEDFFATLETLARGESPRPVTRGPES